MYPNELAHVGVVLFRHGSVTHEEAVRDIEYRTLHRFEGAPPLKGVPSTEDGLKIIATRRRNGSVILFNRSSQAIASFAYSWTFRKDNGHVEEHNFTYNAGPSAMLPFGLDPARRAITDFWGQILPGSKRLITCNGLLFGDNTDVRPPFPSELWRGPFLHSWIQEFNKSRPEHSEFKLDGVFFADGGFVGPNRLHLWDETVARAEAYRKLGQMAMRTLGDASARGDFVSTIHHLIDRLEVKKRMPWSRIASSALQSVSREALGLCKTRGAEEAVKRVSEWAEITTPSFYKV